jgi:hypothetical protein
MGSTAVFIAHYYPHTQSKRSKQAKPVGDSVLRV